MRPEPRKIFRKWRPMFKDKVKSLLEDVLNDDKSLFLIDFSVGADHGIKVVLDGDQGVTLADCMKVSRAIEHRLDRDEYDFSLEVTSAGAASATVRSTSTSTLSAPSVPSSTRAMRASA